MQILVQPCKCSSLHLNAFDFVHNTLESLIVRGFPKCPVPKTAFFTSFSSSSLHRSIVFSKNFPASRNTQLSFCSRNDIFDGFSSTHLSNKSEEDRVRENREAGVLLDKPSPVLRDDDNDDDNDNGSGSEVDEDEALAPFMKFFKSRDGVEEQKEEGVGVGVSEEKSELDYEEEEKKVKIEYYEPKPGDFVVGVVVSGNENKLDVNVGADLLGTMLTKEMLPLYDKEMDYLLCDPSSDAEEYFVSGKMGVVKYDEAVSEESMPGKPVVEAGTVLFAEVLGRTLSGRPLLSTRRFFRRIAWHRVRQIQQLNEPIEVRISEWNTGGLLTRVEGLRAFLPKAELVKKVNNFGELKEKVGCRMHVVISRINESKNDLILSEKEAWQMLYLREGTLLEGTVKKIFPFGAQISMGESNRRGLLHISNITRGKITTVNDLFAVDEKVKVLVVKSMFPDKISLSTADLESEPGLVLTNKERVFSEAEMMAKKYREKLPADLATGRSEPHPIDTLNFENEEKMYANWKWFKFERD